MKTNTQALFERPTVTGSLDRSSVPSLGLSQPMQRAPRREGDSGQTLTPGQAALVRGHIDLADRVAARFLPIMGSRFRREDAVAIARSALCEAGLRFDNTRESKFSSFAFAVIRGALLDAIAANFPGKRAAWRRWREGDNDRAVLEFCRFDEERMAGTVVDYSGDMHDRRQRVALRRALKTLRGRHQKVILDCYFAGKTVADVGREIGVSKSWALRIRDRALGQLREQVVTMTESS